MKWLVVASFFVLAAVAYSDSRCKSASDCSDGECCVKYTILTSFFGGKCKPLRNEGESCTPLVKESNKNPDIYHFQCPCKEGLECVAQHEIKIFDHVIKHKPECIDPTKLSTESEEVTTEEPKPEPETEPEPEPEPER